MIGSPGTGVQHRDSRTHTSGAPSTSTPESPDVLGCGALVGSVASASSSCAPSSPPTDGSVFLVAIQVEALDRTRLLSDVTRVLSDQHVNILSATVTTSRDRVAFSRFTFEMGDPKHLGHVLRAVRAIDGVYDVYRVTS